MAGQPLLPQPPVCGIGASAGGLAALENLFRPLRTDLGIAYVVVVHLSPEHKSELPVILARWTTMPIVTVADHDKYEIEADHVYVIAPGRKLEIHGKLIGAASFDAPIGRRAAIDLFFRSLAKERGDGFAVILSGGGSDGAIGARAIKEGGGLILVQDPAEAEHGDMPKSVISSGIADIVDSAANLASVLATLAQNKAKIPSSIRAPTTTETLNDADERALRGIFELLRKRTAHDFSRYKRGTVLRRLSRRLQLVGQTTIENYAEFLRNDKDEAQHLLGDLLISVTAFFRDPEAWAALRTSVIAPLIEVSEPDEQIRIWVVGCATGEEAYSLAMLLAEEVAASHQERNFIVFASDLDTRALAVAREGVYSQAIAEDLSESRLARFFVAEDDHYRVLPELRERVVFAAHNLLSDPPFSRLNLVTCRNVLIYMDRDLQEHVSGIFRYACREHAHLFLGASEMAHEDYFLALDKKHRIYATRSRAELPSPALDFVTLAANRIHRLLPDPSTSPRRSAGELHQTALERLAPPSVLVDERWMVVHVSNTAAQFFLQSVGAPARRITDLVRPELRDELHAMLHRAAEGAAPQISSFISTRFNGSHHRVAMIVQMRGRNDEQPLGALVTFLDGGAIKTPSQAADDEGSTDAMRGLQEKLRMAEQRIDDFRDDHNAVNEDLRSANEELQSLNEEYRSTTEELETSKEELQSINEELQTVNHELKLKLNEVSRAHTDLENLMASTDLGTLFLDRDLRIRWFTPKLAEIFSIKTRDADRPLSDLTHRLDYGNLERDAQRVLSDLVPIDRDVRSQSGQQYIARLRPYRTDNGRGIGGVVITFFDVTAIRAADAALRDSQDQLESELTVLRRLHKMALSVASSDNLQEALQQILSAAVDLHQAQLGTVHLVDENNRLKLAVQHGFGSMLNAAAAGLPERAVAQAMGSRSPAQIHDIADTEQANSAGLYKAAQIMPAFRRTGDVATLISVFFTDAHQFTGRDGQLGDLLAQQASTMIDHWLQQDRLARLNEILAKRTQELEASREDLAHTAADLIEQDRNRDDFLAALGHELRNPLAAIIGNLVAIQSVDARGQTALDVVSRQSHHIKRLVNDLLDTNRVKRGRFELHLAPVDLLAAVEQALETARPLIEDKQLQMVTRAPVERIVVSADEVRLAQILDNLLRNAVTYTDDGEIVITLSVEERQASVSIRDTGVGIDPADAPHLFELYERGRNRNGAGIGMGLALVKALADAHGGMVTLQSDGVGKGSEFSITLPLYRGDVAQATEPIASSAVSHRVLVVDDQADVAQAFKYLLEALGHDVSLAFSGEEALALAPTIAFSVALVDMSMPDMDGIELTERLRKIFPKGKLQIIGVSGRSDMRKAAIGAGADQFLLKPISPRELTAMFS